MYRVWNFVTDYSLMLISGALIALVWANSNAESFHHFAEYPLIFNNLIGLSVTNWKASFGHGYEQFAIGEATRVISLHYLVNDMLMALFFAIAGKEVWEAIILKNGSLRGRKAITPLFATVGGMLGPVAVYLGLAAFLGSDVYDAVARGWAVPTATDIAFSYLVGRIVFGAGHPAVRFLLLLAIADDAAGLIIIAVFYPTGDLALEWLLLSVGAAVAVYLVFNWLPRKLDDERELRPVSTRLRKTLSVWPYAVAGALSWFGFAKAGIHPSLGLLPVIPAIPHADRAFGFFSEAETYLTDLLNQAEHMLRYPVEVVLFMFGLLNAGVEFSAISSPTWLVLLGLLVGKPFGVLCLGWIAAVPLQLGLPNGMRVRDLFVIGCVAAIGFTVALFLAAVAFPPGEVQDAAKMGALLSFFAAGIAIVVGRVFRVERQPV